MVLLSISIKDTRIFKTSKKFNGLGNTRRDMKKFLYTVKKIIRLVIFMDHGIKRSENKKS